MREKRGSRFLWACIAGPDGKQKQFSTGLTDRGEALAAAVAAERALRKYAEAPHQLRKALDRLAVEYVPGTDTDPSKWLLEWSESRAREVEPATAAKYATTMREASAWLAAEGVKSFSGLTTGRLTELRNHWADLNGAATVTAKMKHLKTALAVAVKEKRISENPALDVGALRTVATRRREFRPEELAVLVPTLAGEWRGMFFLGLYTGQRLNDLAELTWRNVNLAAGTIAFTAAKTGRVVALPLVDAAREALLQLPGRAEAGGLIFPGIAGMVRPARSNAFRKLLAGVGLARHPHAKGKAACGQRETGELCFHSLRHTATSMLKAAGVADSIARAIVGHESAAVSRSYTHLDLATMREAMAKMPAV
ncbi:MAG: site-specific integrase [Verrucomicrobiota bacterium]